jgi:decaprenyl-phosphate phosphoribosyltransferase
MKMNSQMMVYLKLIRAKEWIKNLFIFIPTFFAGTFNDSSYYPNLILGFFSFCFVASAVYILNDFRDRKEDRLHPEKKFRPLASGQVSPGSAIGVMIFLLITGLTLGVLIDVKLFLVLLVYFIMNISYSLGLKHISILDVLILSTGFILRVVAGGIISQVPVSQWLVIMVFLLSLFLSLAKRRDDLLIYLDSNIITRKSIKDYNLEFLNTMLAIFSAIIIVAYIMYTISPEITSRLHSKYIYATVVYVIAGMMRYLQIVFIQKQSGNPTMVLYKDKFIAITLAGWISHYFVILYIPTSQFLAGF